MRILTVINTALLVLVLALQIADRWPRTVAVSPEVEAAAFAELRRLGCVRLDDGTWTCPPGVLGPR